MQDHLPTACSILFFEIRIYRIHISYTTPSDCPPRPHTACQLPLTLSVLLSTNTRHPRPARIPPLSTYNHPPSPLQKGNAYLIISANSFRDTYRSRSRAKFQNTQAVTLKIIAGLSAAITTMGATKTATTTTFSTAKKKKKKTRHTQPKLHI